MDTNKREKTNRLYKILIIIGFFALVASLIGNFVGFFVKNSTTDTYYSKLALSIEDSEKSNGERDLVINLVLNNLEINKVYSVTVKISCEEDNSYREKELDFDYLFIAMESEKDITERYLILSTYPTSLKNNDIEDMKVFVNGEEISFYSDFEFVGELVEDLVGIAILVVALIYLSYRYKKSKKELENEAKEDERQKTEEQQKFETMTALEQQRIDLEKEKVALEQAKLRQELDEKKNATKLCDYCCSANPISATRCSNCGAKFIKKDN